MTEFPTTEHHFGEIQIGLKSLYRFMNTLQNWKHYRYSSLNTCTNVLNTYDPFPFFSCIKIVSCQRICFCVLALTHLCPPVFRDLPPLGNFFFPVCEKAKVGTVRVSPAGTRSDPRPGSDRLERESDDV